jgi:hypothetical protein
MSLFQWFYGASSQAKSEAIIRRVMSRMPYPMIEIDRGLVSVTAERRDTYQVRLFAMVDNERISFIAASGIAIERDLIPRELVLLLLEENHRYQHGSFRLMPQDEHQQLMLGRTLDPRHYPEAKMKPLGESLIENMQKMVRKLYVMGLIINGPEHAGKRQRRG